MYNLQIRTLAKADIQEVVDFYDKISPRIASKFLEHLFNSLEVIQNDPKIFQTKYRKTRVYFMRNYPFGIHYRIIEHKVEVLAVLHTSRSPKTWKERG